MMLLMSNIMVSVACILDNLPQKLFLSPIWDGGGRGRDKISYQLTHMKIDITFNIILY